MHYQLPSNFDNNATSQLRVSFGTAVLGQPGLYLNYCDSLLSALIFIAALTIMRWHFSPVSDALWHCACLAAGAAAVAVNFVCDFAQAIWVKHGRTNTLLILVVDF